MSRALLNLASEEMSPLESQTTFKSYLGGHKHLSRLYAMNPNSWGKTHTVAAITIFLVLTACLAISKTISSKAWQTEQRKGGRGGDATILPPLTFSVFQYLRLLRVQLPVETAHALVHRKRLIVHPQNSSLTFDCGVWYMLYQLPPCHLLQGVHRKGHLLLCRYCTVFH